MFSVPGNICDDFYFNVDIIFVMMFKANERKIKTTKRRKSSNGKRQLLFDELYRNTVNEPRRQP